MQARERGSAAGCPGPCRLAPGQVRDAAAVLARAFMDDPVNREFVPDPAQRRRVLRLVFGFWLRLACLKGGAYASSEKLEGIAVWLRSDRLEVSAWTALRCGGFGLVLGIEPRVLARYQEFERVVRAMQRRLLPEPHLYLATLAVDPEQQGKGFGRRLLELMVEQADRSGQACYLETALGRSVGLYRKSGFEVAEKLTVPGTGAQLWAMTRPPASGANAGAF